MPKIRVEYEVPDNNCIRCVNIKYDSFLERYFCKTFDVLLERDDYRRIQRCQQCLDVEIKEE